MKKIIKIALMLIVVITILICSTVTLLIANINKDSIKNQVTQIVLNKTGKKLTINGTINWSFFPWFGVKAYDLSLSNAPNLNKNDFAKASEASLGIKLFPLIFGRISIGYLTLKDVNLWLIKDNFANIEQDLHKHNNITERPNINHESIFSLTNATIDNVNIKNGQVFWQNQQTKKTFELSKLDLCCKNINFAEPFEIAASFYLKNSNSILNSQIKTSAQIKLDIVNKLYSLKNLHLSGKNKALTLTPPSSFAGEATAEVDLNEQTIVVEKFKLQTANTVISGSLQGKDIIDNPDFIGNLSINNLNPRTLLQTVGMQSYSEGFSNVQLKTSFKVTPKFIQFNTIDANLDGIVLRGNILYSYVNIKDIIFDFYLNKINLDALMQPTTTNNALNTSSGIGKNKLKSQVKVTKSPNNSNTTFDLLRVIKVVGDIKIDSLQLKKLKATNFSTKITSNNGLINCQKIRFDFYRGRANGDLNIDIRNDVAQINWEFMFDKIAMQPLFVDIANYNKFSGTISLDSHINMVGTTKNSIVSSMNGKGNILISSGSYFGMAVPYEVRRASAIINQKPMPPKPPQPQFTSFDRLTASFKINSAFLKITNFLIQAPDYKITGKGDANFASQSLNLKLNAYSMHDSNFFAPIEITGPFISPAIKPDVAVMAKQAIKKEIKKRFGIQLQKIDIPQSVINVLPLSKLLH